jgi:hypothetical protein
MTERFVSDRLNQEHLDFLRKLLDAASKFMVDIEVKTNGKGTYFIQFATIDKGVPVMEKFLSNSPLYVDALLKEVDRYRKGLKQILSQSTDKGPAEKLLFDVEQVAKEALEEKSPVIEGEGQC